MGSNGVLGTLWMLIRDVSMQSALVTVLAVDAYTAYRAHDGGVEERLFGRRRGGSTTSGRFVETHEQSLEGGWAWALPVFAACALVLMYFMIRSVGALLTVFSAIAGVMAGVFFLLPAASCSGRRLRECGLPLPADDDLLAVAVALPVALLIVVAWLMTGHFLANNALCVFTCVLFGAVCRAHSLRTISVLFGGLFVYDVFFVFFSERVFGQNVMVQVAISTANNPAYIVASWLHLPIMPVRNLALPAKLIFPDGQGTYSILGLGDIILPIVLLVFLLDVDLRLNDALWKAFFVRGVITHLLALLLSFYFNVAFQAAQPALFYIVPAMLAVTVGTAWRRRVLADLWIGTLQNLRSVALSESSVESRQRERLMRGSKEVTEMLD